MRFSRVVCEHIRVERMFTPLFTLDRIPVENVLRRKTRVSVRSVRLLRNQQRDIARTHQNLTERTARRRIVYLPHRRGADRFVSRKPPNRLSTTVRRHTYVSRKRTARFWRAPVSESRTARAIQFTHNTCTFAEP